MLELTKDFYGPSEAARVLHISRSTIYRFIDSGRLLPIYDALHLQKIPREQLTNVLLGIQ